MAIWLSCENIAIQRGGRILYHQLGFTLMGGSILTITGKNGAGKTSLLHGLMQWLPLETGHIASEESATRVYIGSHPALKPERTVEDHLLLIASLAQTELMLGAAIRYFGLEPLLELPCRTLSSGWQKRVMLAELLLYNAPIWLLDEPETNLDAEGISRLEHLVRIRAGDGGIILWATHHPQITSAFPALALGDFAVKE